MDSVGEKQKATLPAPSRCTNHCDQTHLMMHACVTTGFFSSLLHRMLILTASLSASSLSRTWWALPLVVRPGVALCPSSPPLPPSCHAPTTRSAWLPSPSPMSISVGPMLASQLVSHPSNGWGVGGYILWLMV